MRIEPFQFDKLRDFAQPEAEAALERLKAQEAKEKEVEEEAPPPPPPTYSEMEMEQARLAAKDRGFEEGLQAGRAQMEDDTRKHVLQMETLTQSATNECAAIQHQYKELFAQQCAILNEYVKVIAGKIAGDLLDASPERAIEQTIERTLPLLIAQPKIQFFVQPDLVDSLHKQLLPSLKQRGLEADIDVLGDEKMESPSDIRIEWKQGHVQREAAEIITAIEQVLGEIDFAAALRAAPTPVEAAPEETEPLELDPKEPELPEPQGELEAEASGPATPEMIVATDAEEDGIEIMHGDDTGETLLSVSEIDDIIEPVEAPIEAAAESTDDVPEKDATTVEETPLKPHTPEEKE